MFKKLATVFNEIDLYNVIIPILTIIMLSLIGISLTIIIQLSSRPINPTETPTIKTDLAASITEPNGTYQIIITNPPIGIVSLDKNLTQHCEQLYHSMTLTVEYALVQLVPETIITKRPLLLEIRNDQNAYIDCILDGNKE